MEDMPFEVSFISVDLVHSIVCTKKWGYIFEWSRHVYSHRFAVYIYWLFILFLFHYYFAKLSVQFTVCLTCKICFC